jgi:DNA-binding transcriptional regulator LsrR (DeoR family)
MTTDPSDTENVACFDVAGSRGGSKAELCDVLSDHIDREEQLRVLLFLSANREQEWTADQLAEALGLSARVTGTALEDLRCQHLVALHYTYPAKYSYRPECEHLDQLLRHMFSSEESLIAMTQQMNAHSIERMRAAAAKAFDGFCTTTRIRRPSGNP